MATIATNNSTARGIPKSGIAPRRNVRAPNKAVETIEAPKTEKTVETPKVETAPVETIEVPKSEKTMETPKVEKVEPVQETTAPVEVKPVEVKVPEVPEAPVETIAPEEKAVVEKPPSPKVSPKVAHKPSTPAPVQAPPKPQVAAATVKPTKVDITPKTAPAPGPGPMTKPQAEKPAPPKAATPAPAKAKSKKMEDKVPCQGFTLKKEPCKRLVDASGPPYCDQHNPAVIAAKEEANKLKKTPAKSPGKVLVLCKGQTIKHEPCQRKCDINGNGYCPSHQSQANGSAPASKSKPVVQRAKCLGTGTRGPCGRDVSYNETNQGFCWSHQNQKGGSKPLTPVQRPAEESKVDTEPEPEPATEDHVHDHVHDETCNHDDGEETEPMADVDGVQGEAEPEAVEA